MGWVLIVAFWVLIFLFVVWCLNQTAVHLILASLELADRYAARQARRAQEEQRDE